jgi:hypothetical protein
MAALATLHHARLIQGRCKYLRRHSLERYNLMWLLLLMFAVCLVFLVGGLVYFPFFVYVAVSVADGVRASEVGGWFSR